MRHRKITFWTVLIMCAVVAGLLLTGCDNVLGEDDSSDTEDENGEDTGDDTEDDAEDDAEDENGEDTGDDTEDDAEDDAEEDSIVSTASWIIVHENAADHPFGGQYRIGIIDTRDSPMRIVFYDEVDDDGVIQVSGGFLPFENDGEEITFEWSHVWLGADPEEDGIDYTGKDWYEIPSTAEAPPGGTMQENGDTLTVDGGGGSLEFSKLSFGVPEDMVESWDLAMDGYSGDLVLGSTSDAPEAGWGSLAYTWNEPDAAEQSGSGYWRASGTTEGYFRQIYTEVSDDEDLEYWEHLTPYTLADNTLTLFTDLAKTESYDYQRPE
jgi:hypothetical protein